MSNPRFSLNDCSVIQQQVRVAADVQDGLTVMQAYEIAEQVVGKLFREAHPSPAPAPSKPKIPARCSRCNIPIVEAKVTPSPGLGGPDVMTHKEKTHTFFDGTVMQCCSATGCGWGRTTKNHSDGMEGGTLYAFAIPDAVEVDDEVETSPDDPRELQADEMRGEPLDEGEVGIVPELPELDEDEDSASKEDEEYESCEA